MTRAVTGVGLFSGAETTVQLTSTSRATELFTAQGGGALDSWSVAPAFRTTSLAHASGAKIACVEHLFAALAAYRAHHGVSIFVRGGELPILDGAAAAWCALLDEMSIEGSPSRLEVTRDDEIAVERSIYRFRRADSLRVSVEIDFDDEGSFGASLPKHAEWNGTRDTFVSSIARARTFVFAREVGELAAAGASAHAPEETFLVIGKEGVKSSGRPFEPEEPARHKLLDFMGDLFAAGGPPIGSVHAVRPGHARSREAMRLALELGVLRRA